MRLKVNGDKILFTDFIILVSHWNTIGLCVNAKILNNLQDVSFLNMLNFSFGKCYENLDFALGLAHTSQLRRR